MKIIFFLYCFLFHLFAVAQEYSPEKLLDPTNPAYFKETVNEVYNGVPIVKMGGKSIKKTGPKLNVSSKKELEKVDIPLNLIYNIKTPFGIKKTAGNTDHTTDFYSKIQIVDNKNVLVQETIQFVTTKPTKIERVLPLSYNNIPEIEPNEIEVLSFDVNGKRVHYNITQENNLFKIQSSKEFPNGVHLINFKYIRNNAIQEVNSTSRLFLSLTGGNWAFPINRFRAIVLYPHSPISYQKNLLFGNNNVLIEDNIQISTDIKGNTLYTTTRPLPAFVDVRVFETFDGKNLPLSLNENFTKKYFNYLLAFATFFCFTIYLILSSIFLKKTSQKKETVLKKINNLPTSSLMLLEHKKFSVDILSDLKRIEKTCSKFSLKTKILRACFKIKWIGFLLNILLKGCGVFYLTYKYILTGAVIFFIIMHPLFIDNFQKNIILIGVILLTCFIELIIFYQKTLKPIYIQDIIVFKEKIINPYLCFGLKPKTILSFYKRYYKTTYILGIHLKLKQIMEEQTKDISLPTTKNREK